MKASLLWGPGEIAIDEVADPDFGADEVMIQCGYAGICGTALYFPITVLIHQLSPEVSTENTYLQILFVLLIAVLTGLLSSFIAIRRIRKIYALEVFYDR